MLKNELSEIGGFEMNSSQNQKKSSLQSTAFCKKDVEIETGYIVSNIK